ncbi:MAG: VaFE repeat-containing surface-anchored protein, partial [Wujia sp.]
MRRKRKLIALLLAVLMIITTVNFNANLPEAASETSEILVVDYPDTETEEITSEEPESEDPVSEDPAPEDPASEEVTTEDPAPEDPASEAITSEDLSLEDPVPEEPVSEETATEEAITEAEEMQVEEAPVEGIAAALDGLVSGIAMDPQGDFGTWTVTGATPISSGSSSGHIFTVNNGTSTLNAYCCNKANENTPTGGSAAEVDVTDTVSNDIYRKVFYYGYGGPGQLASITSEAQGSLAMAQTLSKYYSGTSNSFSWFETEISSLTVPSATISITEPESTKAAITTVNGSQIQKTGTYKVDAPGHTDIQVGIPDGVTLYTGGTGYTGSVILSDGAEFYLTAPVSLSGTYASIKATATGTTVSRVYSLTIGALQPLMFAKWIKPSTTYSAEFGSGVKIRIKKTSSNTTVSNDTSAYDLSGAVFGIYKSKADAETDNYTDRKAKRVATLTTDEDGIATSSTLAVRDYYYIREEKAPEGFVMPSDVSARIKKVDTAAGETSTIEVKNTPVTASFMIVKTSTKPEWTKNNDCYSLEDAHFKVYKTRSDAENDTNALKFEEKTYSSGAGYYAFAKGSGTTSIIKTNASGKVNITNLPMTAAGEEIYYIRETKASKGFAINTKIFKLDCGYTTDDATDGKLDLGEVTVPETPKGDPLPLVIVKADKNQDASGNKIYLDGAKFEMKYYPTLDKTEITNGTVKATATWYFKSGEYTTTSGATVHGRVRYDSDHLLSTGKNGKSSDALFINERGNPSIPLGIITVQEYEAPEGYVLDDTVRYYKFTETTIEWDDTQIENARTVTNEKTPFYGKIKIIKKDDETGKSLLHNSASFKIWSYSEEDYVAFDETDAEGNQTLTDILKTNDQGELITPGKLAEGKYRIEEVETPDNYYNDNTAASYDIVIDREGTFETYLDENGTEVTDMGVFKIEIDNTPLKGQIEINKSGETRYWDETAGEFKTSVNPLGNILFGIYANEDIYSADGQGDLIYKKGDLAETIETDADGHAVSSELPLGTYLIKEENTPEGYIEMQPVTVTLAESGNVITTEDGNTVHKVVFETKDITNKPVVPSIKTSAKDGKTQDHTGVVDEITTIIDKVTYKDLIVGKKYTVKGVLMDKETGETIKVNGNPVTAEKTFTAENKNGYVELTFTLDSSVLAGKTTVVFEDLYQDGRKVATHSDLSDEDQTIYYPKIGTTAKDSVTGTDTGVTGEDSVIIDTVAYSNMVTGDTYVVKGMLMDKATGKPVKEDGKVITGEAEFKASEPDGTVDVSYTFDSRAVAGKDVVVFEYLYKDGIQIASHADINDPGQTIHYPSIKTTAKDVASDSHTGTVSEETTITDKVSYRNLIIGKVYTVKGVLIEKVSGEPLVINGEEIRAEKTFTAEKKNGYVELSFTFDSSALKSSVVVFEDLYQDEKKIATHSDIEDKDQTVYYPSLYTTAKDKATGTNVGSISESFELIDTVTYEGLEKGKQYVIRGVVMDKATESPLIVNGKEIRAEKEFVAKEGNGTIDISYQFSSVDLRGKDIVVFEYLYRNGSEVTSHADINDHGQTVSFPTIKTTARDSVTGTHTGTISGQTTIIDKVSYENLIVGKEYTVKGTLMVKETGEPLVIDGNNVTAEKTFTAEKRKGYVELTFTFDSSALAGFTTVVFEDLYHNGIKVATHSDITDEDQTIYYPEIGTTAKDPVTGTNTGSAVVNATIIDTVYYKNLIPGEKYELKGVLMDKKTGEKLVINGAYVTADATFEAKSRAGQVDVTFNFDASGLLGKEVVVFEELYLDGDLIAGHADLNDHGQTIRYPNPDTPHTGDTFP